ncbi:NAD(P)/FAD-dependent oxidoreductase [Pseudonocardia sp. CA-107938]|uniref:NAD(P)/FAD-dependent oxidoreductase n=1 Tax=Pseudonocardia sp. CA-107938 TaxID=3240021 RepID=UPI003D8C1479
MNDTTEFLIVGGGLEGLAIAWSLAEQGATDVTVVERATLCSGMTGKSSAVARCHYGVPSLAAMALYGIEFMARAKDILGEDVGLRRCGYVIGVDENNVDALKNNVAMQQGLGVDVDLLPTDRVAELWPGLYLDDFALFAHEPGSGRGEAYLTGMAYATDARRRGVRIRQHTTVTSLLHAHDRVVGVHTETGERIDARTVVLANGAWSAALAAGVGVDVPVCPLRTELVLVDQGDPTPDVPVLSDLVEMQYLCREPNGDLLVGNSDHSIPDYVDPDRYRDRADDLTIERVVSRLAHRLPDMPDPRVTGSYAGVYDVTPDFNPIIGPSPVGGLFLAVGFSGHGFKIAPAVGRLAAAQLTGERVSLREVNPLDFRHARFAEQDLLQSPHPYVGADGMR